MSYQPDENLPPIVDQPLSSGTWKAGNPMMWVSETGAMPVGPLLPQEHPEGMWIPGSGGFMTWVPAVSPEPEVIPVVIVAGDEDQGQPEETPS